MNKIRVLGPDAEVLGGAIHGFIDAINHENILPHLEKLNMTEIDPEAWYPKKLYVDLWNSILESSNSSMSDLVGAGMTIAQNAWPAELDGLPFETILTGWGDSFDAVNRGADRGYIRTEKLDAKHYAIVHCTPDPDDLHYGVVYGVCKRFLPKGTDFVVKYDDEVTRRDFGGDETIIHIEWE